MEPTTLAAAGPRAQHAALVAGRTDAVALTGATLDAAAALDARVGAFVAIDREGALAAAAAADRRRADGEGGPLLGVPIALKDDLDVAGRVTTWGSRAMTRAARADHVVVRRIRAAGMVPIGHTTLPELAVYGFTESERLGVTRNPVAPTRTPGGSSGGSAAAVAGGAVGIAAASDGAGSIRIPAACCGLVGIKPGAGTTPGSGWHGLAVNGCLTRSVADSAVYLDMLRGSSSLLTASQTDPAPLRIGMDLRAPLALSGPVDQDVAAAVERTGQTLARLGHRVRTVRVRPSTPTTLDATARYLRSIHDSARDTDDPELLEARTREIARLGRLTPGALMAGARARGEAYGRRALDDLGVDVLLTPTMSGPALPVGHWAGSRGLTTALGMARFYAFTPIWNHTGQPAASLPAGTTLGGLPLAIQLVVGPGQDARLVALAGQLERAAAPA